MFGIPKVPTLPPAVQAEASGLGQEVAGGQISQIDSQLGPAAQEPATDSFVAGYHWAMAAGSVALAAAGTTALIGLRPKRAPHTQISPTRPGVLQAEEG